MKTGNTSLFGMLDARVKLAYGFSVSVLAILADSLPALGVVAGLGLAAYCAIRPNSFQWKLALFSTCLLVWGVMLSQGLFYNEHPRTVLIQLLPPNIIIREGLRIYHQGIRHGLMQSLRLLGVTFTGYAICFSTSPDHFFRALISIRAPFSMSFMAVTAIRFIPLVAQEFTTVRKAMTMKGYRPFRLGFRDTLRTEVAAFRPVLAGAIRRSEEVALSVLTRGFSFDKPRSSLHEDRLHPALWGLIGVMGIILTLVAIMKVLFILYQNGFYYSSALRGVYQFTRDWL